MTLPKPITAGDSLNWTEQLTDYPASDGWTLHFSLVNSVAAYVLDSTADGDDHVFDIDVATTTPWAEGRYDVAAYVTHTDGRKCTLYTDAVTIQPDPTVPRDARSHAQKMVDAIEALLENRATSGDMDMLRGRFKEREIEQRSGELLTARDIYRAEVVNEQAAEALARGERLPGRNVKVRFV